MHYPIHHWFRNWSLLNLLAFAPAYFLPTYLPYRKWIQMNILSWLVDHLYTTCTICDYWRHISTKCNCCIYFVRCQNFFDFSDNIVSHDSSSVHVQVVLATGPDLGSNFTVPTPLPPIKYLSSHRIVTWSVGRICSCGRSFTSRFSICNATDIRWVAVKERPM